MTSSIESGRRYSSLDIETIDPLGCYKLLTGSVVPRPIAWVTTRSPSGVVNAAPFSQFMIASYEPPLLAVGIGQGATRKKDTQANIEATLEFVVNMVPEHAAQLIQRCAEDFPPEVSEAEVLGLELLPSERLAVPRLALSAIQFECRLHRMVGVGNSQLILGRVVMMHADADLLRDQKIDADTYRTLARIGGRNYLRFGEIVSA